MPRQRSCRRRCSAKCAMCVRGWGTKRGANWRGGEKWRLGLLLPHTMQYIFALAFVAFWQHFFLYYCWLLFFCFCSLFSYICLDFRCLTKIFFFLRLFFFLFFILCIAWLTVARHWWRLRVMGWMGFRVKGERAPLKNQTHRQYLNAFSQKLCESLRIKILKNIWISAAFI